jgi:hypothetical protein
MKQFHHYGDVNLIITTYVTKDDKYYVYAGTLATSLVLINYKNIFIIYHL